MEHWSSGALRCVSNNDTGEHDRDVMDVVFLGEMLDVYEAFLGARVCELHRRAVQEQNLELTSGLRSV